MSEITEFYLNKTILVTGATGFLGKMTVEKLLRSCDPAKIFVLLRSKKGESPQQRLEKFLDSTMFSNLSKEKADFQRKIELLEGDIQCANLGLKPEDVQKIIREVDVIMHWAATINFSENFKIATNINVKPVRELLGFARKMPHLKSFLTCSTAYSHCLRKDIDEIFYDDNIGGNNLITCMDSLTEKDAEDITAGLLGDWPNTYVYTKSAAENIIKTEGVGLPVGIFRPSIVTGAYKEPIAGWVDNSAGFTGLLMAIALGYIRVTFTDPKLKTNFVPADYVVNSAIAAAWQISQQDRNELSIYNYTDTSEHCLTHAQIRQMLPSKAMKLASTKVVWHYSLFQTRNALMFKILDYLLHYLPAKLVDFFYVCSGKSPRFVKIYNKMHKMSEAILYFTGQEWNFNNKNVVNLWNSMSEKDKELFDFDLNSLDWNDYYDHYLLGIRLYILKDPIETIPAGKRKVLKLKIINYTLLTFLSFALYYMTTWILHLFI